MPGGGMQEGLLMPPVPDGYQSDEHSVAATPRGKSWWGWWARCWCMRRRQHRDTPVSGYEVIIRNGVNVFGTNTLSLSDPRLKPKVPKCLIAFLVILCLAAILAVFFLVPRGVLVDEPEIKKNVMTRTYTTYTLVVDVGVPISNRNFLPVHVSGNVSMYYYQQMAGSSLIPDDMIGARSKDQVQVAVNASFVPLQYVAAVIEECSFFPFELVFFLEGFLEIKTAFERRTVHLDSYSFIKCPEIF